MVGIYNAREDKGYVDVGINRVREDNGHVDGGNT